MGQPPLRVDFFRSIDGLDEAALFSNVLHTSLDGVDVPVISLDNLITNKRVVGRPQDLIDADYLEKLRAKK